MKLFKVIFNNNKPVSASRLEVNNTMEIINVIKRNNKKFIDWLVVNGDDEKEAISAANDVIQTYRDAFLA